jgi:NAD(P) transhydrogenase subunit alpha
MDQVPRISRAQKMDALSSMANIAGYRAVIEAASFYGRFFTGQMTAAGRVAPAKVLIIGAGVAGLAAIGAARGLGAIVRAFDTRPTVKDQVKSMGAEFIELNVQEEAEGAGGYAKEMSPAFIAAEMAMFAAQAKEVDIIITTALIPNRPAPVLITEDMVKTMKKGSVIVDLAAENGGNCALTEPGTVVERYGVHILGYTDLPSRLAPTSSFLYGNNLGHLLSDMGGGAGFKVDVNDEVVRGALVLLNGEVMWPPPKREVPPAPAAPAAKPSCAAVKDARPGPGKLWRRHRNRPGAGCRGVRRAWPGCATVVPDAPHRVRAGLHRRVAGGVERHASAAHAADERDQRDQRHHRHRGHVAGERARLEPCRAARRGRHPAGDHQHCGRLPRDAEDAEDVHPPIGTQMAQTRPPQMTQMEEDGFEVSVA